MEKIVLIHGALGSADQMVPLAKELGNSFEVHNFEFDGHGASSAVPHNFSISNFVIQLDSFLDSLNGSAHLFGYSMGGFVALISAARGNQKIQSITTLGTKLSWDKHIADNEIKKMNPEKIKEKVPKFFEMLQKRHGAHWVDVLSRTSDFMASLGMSNPINKELMLAVKCPVMLLVGDQDLMVSVEETEQVSNWIERSTCNVLPDTEHAIEKIALSMLSKRIVDFCFRGL